jgi:hypothetical protein
MTRRAPLRRQMGATGRSQNLAEAGPKVVPSRTSLCARVAGVLRGRQSKGRSAGEGGARDAVRGMRERGSRAVHGLFDDIDAVGPDGTPPTGWTGFHRVGHALLFVFSLSLLAWAGIIFVIASTTDLI